jgi:TolB protein
MNADGSGQRPLTNETDAASLTPVVSPTSRQIAFTRETPTEPPKIWVMNADGTGQRPLTGPGDWEDSDPAWSVDGPEIAFSRLRPGLGSEIFIMGADGSSPKALTNLPGADWAPTFSPDNRYIAWTAFRQGDFDVWVMNRDGSDKIRLTTDPAFDGFPDWHQERLGR